MSNDSWKPRGPIGYLADLIREKPGSVIFWTLFAAFLYVMLFGQGWLLPGVE